MFRKAAPGLGAFSAALIAVGLVAAQSKPMPPVGTNTSPTMRPLYVPMPETHLTVACGVTVVPYSTIYRPSTGDTEYAARFSVQGSGTITLSVNAPNGYTFDQVQAPCDPCELSVQHAYSPSVQIAVDAAASACPSGSLMLDSLNTYVGP